MTRASRRDLLKAGLAATLSPSWLNCEMAWADDDTRVLPVTAIVTEYRVNSHADVIVGKILNGFRQNGGRGPALKLVSMYTDQVPANDMSRGLSTQYGFPISKTIDDAITLGTDRVQVAGVLSIGEHGNYPMTPDTGQHMYPRRRFFDEVVATFRRTNQVVPVFNDKHLGFRWDDASYMVATAQAMKFPLLAGSSVPLAWRLPIVELPPESEIEAAVTIGYGGLEAYGFHALEAHQCMIERRKGGEIGVASVQAVQGDAFREAKAQDRWSKVLFEAALQTLPGSPKDQSDWIKPDSAAYLLQHHDGLKSAVIMTNGLANEFATAVKLKNRPEPIATWFKLQPGAPFGHFAYLVRAAEHTIRTGTSAYPVERTLMTTGILDRVMHSLAKGGAVLESPELKIAYQPVDWTFANHPRETLVLPNN